ncbi:MAG: glycoside hydrolase domain-containing protein, partial [Solirubrobacteraceae bacterium]
MVEYHGYEIQVPVSWPVYNLAADPARCVLFNQHAVYLGTPGADQRCPVRAFGRTGAVLVQPEQTSVSPGTLKLGADTASFSGALPANDTTSHVVQVAAPGPGVLVTATYGSDEAQIRSILAGARMTAKSSTAASSNPASKASAMPVTGRAAAGSSSSSGGTMPELSLQQGQGLGVDACTVPSAATMTDWLASPYRVIGTYLGGVNWACSYGNFSSTWASEVAAEGWRYIPIWVGPQAPCTTIEGATVIDTSNAAAQGEAEAASAAAAAQGFGYGKGTPIYFDMEGYDSSDTSCAQAVMTFLGGWTAGLHAAGYLSGVYSSAASGIADLAAEYTNPDYQRPDDVWVADWNGDPVLSDPYLP